MQAPKTLSSYSSVPVASMARRIADSLQWTPFSPVWGPYRITQQPPPSLFSNMSNDALVAASNTSSTPSPLRLEHSRYLRAPISLATCSPSAGETKRLDRLRISSIATGSSRRSFFRPTTMIGTPGQRSCASTNHYGRAGQHISPYRPQISLQK